MITLFLGLNKKIFLPFFSALKFCNPYIERKVKYAKK
jgi:hypothetical protein